MWQFYNQFKKDFKLTFINPVFFVIAGGLCTVWSFDFPRRLIAFGEQSVRETSPFQAQGMAAGGNIIRDVFMPHVSLTHIFLLLVVPVITMRLLSEEKKLRTFDLLLTSPITSLKLILGKFCAAYLVGFLLLVISFLYPLFSGLFAEYNMKLLLSAYMAISLLVMVYTAIGLLSSALTSSIMLSSVLGIVFNLSLHFMSNWSTSDNPVMSRVMEYLTLFTHLDGFFQGNIALSSILFFFILTGFFLFLCQRFVEFSRWSL